MGSDQPDWIGRELRLLAEADAVLASSLEESTRLQAVAQLVVPTLADWCAIDLYDQDTLRPVAIAHANPARLDLLGELRRRYPPGPEDWQSDWEALRTGVPQLTTELPESLLEVYARDDRHLELLRALAPRSLMLVPLETGGAMLGLVTFGLAESGRRYGQDDLALAQELARRCALAIENGRLARAAQEVMQGWTESLAQLDTLLAAAPAGLAFLDRDLRYVRVNEALASLNGVSAEAHRGRAVAEIIPRLAPMVEPLMRRVLETGVPVLNLELRSKMADLPGEPHTWLASFYPVRARTSEILGLGVVVLEVTEQRRAEEARAQLALERVARAEAVADEARLHHLLEAVPDAIVTVDREGRIVLVNVQTERLFGYTREELLGKPVEVLVPERLREAHVRHREAYALSSYTRPMGVSAKLVGRRKEGGEFPIDISISPVESDGQLLVTAMVRDLSQRPVPDRGEWAFVATVAHELRNPLTTVRGYAQLMQQRGSYSERALDAIVAQADRLNRLVDDLLGAALLETERLRLRPSPVDLAELARACVRTAGGLTRRYRLLVEAPATMPPGSWDRGRLEQVLQNLLSNAIRYSPGGGDVVVRVEDLGSEARLSVRDQGIGIPPEALPRLFERFYRVEDAAAAGVQGLGLGLYVVRSLVEAHGGRLDVASTPGAGSTFTVTLPYEPGTPRATAAAGVEVSPPSQTTSPDEKEIVHDQRIVTLPFPQDWDKESEDGG